VEPGHLTSEVINAEQGCTALHAWMKTWSLRPVRSTPDGTRSQRQYPYYASRQRRASAKGLPGYCSYFLPHNTGSAYCEIYVRSILRYGTAGDRINPVCCCSVTNRVPCSKALYRSPSLPQPMSSMVLRHQRLNIHTSHTS
jgi:hypothetical protein